MRQDLLFGGGAALVLRNVGLLLRYMAPIPLALLPFSFYYDELDAVVPVLLMAFTFWLAGSVLARVPTRREPRLREGLLIAAVGWAVVPLGSVVLFMQLEGWRPLDAYFEAMSAWTGTGMSIAQLDTLHRTTLVWRTLMQWVGGLGVIVLTLAILARPGTGAHTLYVSEGRDDKLRPSVLSTVRTLWRLYALLTVFSVLLLLAAGFDGWEAFNHALTGIATGGMSVHQQNTAYYGETQQLALIPLMILGGFPFVALYALFRGRARQFFGDVQVRAFFVVMLGLGTLLTASLLRLAPEGAERAAIVAGAFQAVSTVSTTGFQTIDLTTIPAGTKIAIAAFMLLGGAAGSTAGGVKLFRGVLLFQGALWKLGRSGLPHFAVTTFRFGGERLEEREANEEFADAAFIVVLWVAAVFVGAITLFNVLPGDAPAEHVFFDLASAVSNNGLSTGIVHAGLSDPAKVTFVLLMWAGRLEILPVLLLLRGLFPHIPKR